jgi:ATP dependent DNA ligase C terminal region
MRGSWQRLLPRYMTRVHAAALGSRSSPRSRLITLDLVVLGRMGPWPAHRLAWQTAELCKLAIANDPYTVYVQPKLVVEIAFNDTQASPHYSGALALRFARVKRYRPDKKAEEAYTIETTSGA